MSGLEMLESEMQLRRYYVDLREWLDTLRKNELLHSISRPVVKETDISSIVRLQFRGLPENKRGAFLFENVIDSKNRKYESKVATGVYCSSLRMYALGLKCEATREAIGERWNHALLNPIEPRVVKSGPVQDSVLEGNQLLEDGMGLEALPIPVEAPGFSGQIRTTTFVITKDPSSGWVNMGNYSGHIFGKTKILWEVGRNAHGYAHWKAWKELGKPMPLAIVIGGPPSYFYLASAKVQYGVSELAVAGGFSGETIELVKCKTIDLEVPAHAEFVIEGLVSTEYMEPGNAYGEYTGYMATDIKLRPVMEVTCVTHRRNPIYVHLTSQLPPSESSLTRKIGFENNLLKYLRHDCKLPGILDVSLHENSGAQSWLVVKIRKENPWHSSRVLHTTAGYDAVVGKFTIVVDEDIDPNDMDSVLWAMAWRVQPARDMLVIKGKYPTLDPSAYKPDAPREEKQWPQDTGSSAVLIDATAKWNYPPTSLPRKEYMEKALQIWQEERLPELNLKQPWYGYELGYWPEQFREDADLVVKGEHYKIGERLAKGRVKA
jgi:UbiD family decarboxylase